MKSAYWIIEDDYLYHFHPDGTKYEMKQDIACHDYVCIKCGKRSLDFSEFNQQQEKKSK